MLYGPAENVATTRNGERWPTPKEEAWIARQLGRPDLFAGVTTAEERRERVAKRIGEIGPDEVWREGRTESWAEVFRRAYGIALEEATR